MVPPNDLNELLSPEEAQAFLYNNDPPPEEDLPKIRAFIAKAQDGLEALNAILLPMLMQRAMFEEILRKHTPLVLPIRRVPPEVWAEIFRWNLVDNQPITECDPPSPPPWLPAQVCRSWRAAALAESTLWSCVYIHYLLIPEPLELEEQLRRSRNASLDVFFYWKEDYAEYLLELLDLLVAQSSRWERATIYWAETNPGMVHSMSRIAGQLPRLKHLTSIANKPRAIPRDLFADASSLREVLLTETEEPFGRHVPDSPLLSAPWAQITRFRVRLGPEPVLEILRAMHQLRECGIYKRSGDAAHDFFATTSTMVLLPHLRRLCVWDARFLRVLEAPRLQYLMLDATGGQDAASSFIRRSGCQVLGLKIFDWGPDAVINLLGNIPGLKYLELGINIRPGYNREDSDENLRTMFAALGSASSPSLCPDLTSFIIERPSAIFGRDIYQRFFEMIVSRWHPGTPQGLKSVVFLDQAHQYYRGVQSLEESHQQWIQELRADGLDIRFDPYEDKLLNSDMELP
ncbi:hypothetical protein B0H15DRAFT_815545 [Mycena belliarum]|uniref:F-box domain-containing protein n=1 Tax=Mycena belliarum TaxID=1033014 RepID=A0AAD6UI63_9AGAR|nr:hypothetical protein B0H15DRAFT_815545 [Mycena belliae]